MKKILSCLVLLLLVCLFVPTQLKADDENGANCSASGSPALDGSVDKIDKTLKTITLPKAQGACLKTQTERYEKLYRAVTEMKTCAKKGAQAACIACCKAYHKQGTATETFVKDPSQKHKYLLTEGILYMVCSSMPKGGNGSSGIEGIDDPESDCIESLRKGVKPCIIPQIY